MVSLFINSGAGLGLSMVCFSPIVFNSENKFIIVKLTMMWVQCIIMYMVIGKAAELSLAKS